MIKSKIKNQIKSKANQIEETEAAINAEMTATDRESHTRAIDIATSNDANLSKPTKRLRKNDGVALRKNAGLNYQEANA